MADERFQLGRFRYTFAECEYQKFKATAKVYERVIGLIDEMLAATENNSLELRALKGDIYANYIDHLEALADWKEKYEKEQAEDLERMQQSNEVEETPKA